MTYLLFVTITGFLLTLLFSVHIIFILLHAIAINYSLFSSSILSYWSLLNGTHVTIYDTLLKVKQLIVKWVNYKFSSLWLGSILGS